VHFRDFYRKCLPHHLTKKGPFSHIKWYSLDFQNRSRPAAIPTQMSSGALQMLLGSPSCCSQRMAVDALSTLVTGNYEQHLK